MSKVVNPAECGWGSGVWESKFCHLNELDGWKNPAVVAFISEHIGGLTHFYCIGQEPPVGEFDHPDDAKAACVAEMQRRWDLEQAKAKPAFYWDDRHYRPIEGVKINGKTRAVAYVYEHNHSWHYRASSGDDFGGGWFDSEAIAKEKCELAVAAWLADKEKQGAQDTPPEAEPLTESIKVEAPEVEQPALNPMFISTLNQAAPTKAIYNLEITLPLGFDYAELAGRYEVFLRTEKQISLSKNADVCFSVGRDGEITTKGGNIDQMRQALIDLEAMALLFWGPDWKEEHGKD